MDSETPAVQHKLKKFFLFLELIEPLWSKRKTDDKEECKHILKKVCMYCKDYDIADYLEAYKVADCFFETSMLEILINGNKWLTLRKLLSKRLATEEFQQKERMVVEKAFTAAKELAKISHAHENNNTKMEKWQIHCFRNASDVLVYCQNDQIIEILKFLLQEHLWQQIKCFLQEKKSIDEHVKIGIVVEAISYTKQMYVDTEEDVWNDALCILEYCSSDQVPNVVSHLTHLQSWEHVITVIESHRACINEPLLEWVVQQACNVAEDGQAADKVLPLALDHQLDTVIEALLTWRHWYVLWNLLMERNLTVSQIRRIVTKAIEHIDDDGISLVLLYCTEEYQLRSLLEQLVSERRWTVVSDLLLQGYASEKILSWLVENTNEQTIKLAIDPQINSIFKYKFIYNVEVMNRNLLHIKNFLLEKGQWQAVRTLLKSNKRELTTDQVNSIIKKALHGSDKAICPITDLLEFVPEDMLFAILVYLGSLGEWHHICLEISRRCKQNNKFSDLKDWAVSEFFVSIQSLGNCCNNDNIILSVGILFKWIEPTDIESWLRTFVSHGLWSCVDVALQRGVSEELKHMVIEKLVNVAQMEMIELSYAVKVFRKYGSENTFIKALERCVALKLWNVVETNLNPNVPDSVREWAVKHISQDTLRRCSIFIPNDYADDKEPLESFIAEATKGHLMKVEELRKTTKIQLNKHLCYLLYISLNKLTKNDKDRVTDVNLSTSLTTHPSLGPMNGSSLCFEVVVTDILHVLADTVITRTVNKMKTMVSYEQLRTWIKQLECIDTHAIDEAKVLQKIMKRYSQVRNGQSDKMLYRILSMLPLLPTVQEIALNYMLKKRRWKVISHACLTRVPEMLRRTLFKAAVQQGQWAVVKQWADHSLYDDQRGWAMEEACRHRQWAAYLRLADHSLQEHEITYVLYKIINNINSDDESKWNVVLDALERCADVDKLRQLLKPEEKVLQRDLQTMERRQRTGLRLNDIKRCLVEESKNFFQALRAKRWAAVVCRLLRQNKRSKAQKSDIITSDKLFSKIIKQIIKHEAWHVVSRLLKLGTTQLYRDQLFAQMINIRQWPVCRTLLELGVSHEAIETSIPSLMFSSQWILLARVLEYDSTTDEKRKEIIFHAVKRSEGSLVWHGLQMLQNRLTESEREELFSLALRHNVLQALRPLVAESDSLGLKHRDQLLLKAFDYNQWDIVDHCLCYGGNIDLCDKGNNSTLLKKSYNHDWHAVEELASRGADVTCANDSSTTALHFAVSEKQWDTARLLIQYHSKLKQCTKFGRNPLRGIIDERQAGLIECALLWSHDFHTDKNRELGTPLHAACAAGWRHVLRHLVARGCDPLALTKAGKSVLAYAVELGGKKIVDKTMSRRKQYREKYKTAKKKQTQDETQERRAKEKAQSRAHRMLAQCIKLGFSTHQPAISRRGRRSNEGRNPTSALWHAFDQDSLVLMHMLYESGACSNQELFYMYRYVYGYSNPVYDLVVKLASTPRSLQSCCRLVISHSINVRGKRFKEVRKLPYCFLRNPVDRESPLLLWDYILFSDVTDPFIGNDNI